MVDYCRYILDKTRRMTIMGVSVTYALFNYYKFYRVGSTLRPVGFAVFLE